MKIILASASLRRQELLMRIINDFIIYPSSVDETIVKYKGKPSEYVMEIAKLKAMDTAKEFSSEDLIIGCDTVVFLEGEILTKPKDKHDAIRILKKLSGKFHEVYSGISVIKDEEIILDYVMTKVKFKKLSEEEILRYVATGEPMDKAGAYGIQGKGGVFVEKIEGCYYNVVGLPLNKLYNLLGVMGVNY